MNNKEEILCKYVEYNDLENIQRLLDEGKYTKSIAFLHDHLMQKK